MADTRDQENSILFELNKTFSLLESLLGTVNKLEDKINPILRPSEDSIKDAAALPISHETSELWREIHNANMKLADLESKINYLTNRVTI